MCKYYFYKYFLIPFNTTVWMGQFHLLKQSLINDLVSFINLGQNFKLLEKYGIYLHFNDNWNILKEKLNFDFKEIYIYIGDIYI